MLTQHNSILELKIIILINKGEKTIMNKRYKPRVTNDKYNMMTKTNDKNDSTKTIQMMNGCEVTNTIYYVHPHTC